MAIFMCVNCLYMYCLPMYVGGRENCVDHDIRLAGGDSEREGLVEVCFDGVWGTICDDRLYNYDYYHERLDVETQANVICRQLGFLEPNTSKYQT